MQPRRLPLYLPLEVEESFISWVRRYGAFTEIPHRRLLERLRLLDDPHGYRGVRLSKHQAEVMGKITGIRPELFQQTLLSVYQGTAVDLTPMNTQRRILSDALWCDIRGSRACVLCLRKSPVWRVWWRLEIALVCPIHNVFLSDRCASCGTRHLHGAKQQEAVTNIPVLDLGICGARVGRARCTAQIDQNMVITAPAELVRLQHQLLSIANGASARIAKRTVSANTWFRSLYATTQLVRNVITTGDADLVCDPLRAALTGFCERRDNSTINAPMFSSAPREVMLSATVLTLADRILSNPQALDLLATPFGETLRNTHRVRRNACILHPDLPIELTQVLKEVRRRSRRFVGLIESASVRPETVPQLLPLEHYKEIENMIPGTYVPKARLFGAMAVLRASGFRSWGKAAEYLGVPARTGSSFADRCSRRIVNPDEFWSLVAAIAENLRTADINYQLRRAQLQDFEIGRETWATLCEVAGVPSGRRGSTRHAWAGAWVWSELTSGDVRFSPAVNARPGDRETALEMCRRFRLWLPQELADLLIELGMRRISDHR